MKPTTRKELYLNKIVGNNDYEIPEKPITTEEFFFAEILGEAVQAPEPLTRYQMYLAKIAGREIEIPYPEVRIEYFLARAAGMEIEAPTPITREEIFWSNYSAIIDFELEGVPPLSFKANAGVLKDYRIYGQTSRNLFDVSTITLGCYINDEGQIIQNDDINTSDFIKVYPNTNYTYKGAVIYDANIIRIAYYDQSKNFISRYFTPGNAANGETITTPSNCEYVKLSYDNVITNLMLNTGSTPLPYEPYGESIGDRTGNLFDENATGTPGYLNDEGDTQTLIGGWMITPYIAVSGEYINISGFVGVTPAICAYDNNKQFVRGEKYNGASQKTINVSDCAFIRASIPINDASVVMINYGSTALPYEPYGYRVPVTVEGKNLFNENSLISPIFVRNHYLSWHFDDEHYLLATDNSIDDRPWSYDYSQFHIALSSGTYTIQLSGVAASNQFAGIYITNSNNDRICSENISGKTSSVMTFTLNTPETIGIEIKVLDGKFRIMLVEGSTPIPYGPYQPPVTTPIYLPEQIKKVGDEAEYIDYAEQKLHRVGAEDIDVTLPALPTLAGTNTLTVGTAVQPSKVYIKGQKEREYS